MKKDVLGDLQNDRERERDEEERNPSYMCVFVDDESTWRTSCGGKGKMEELACVNGSLWSNYQGLIIKALGVVRFGWVRLD